MIGIRDFVAIDFETANSKRSSICSVGVVVVRNAEVESSIYRLIRPRPNMYNYHNTRVHGMCYEDTISAPDFPLVWNDIAPHIGSLPLVAHNSPFDEGCLKAVFELYGMNYPSYKFYCTCRAARRRYPLLANHQLKTVATHCGFDLKNHHHALSDAEACAAIALTLL